MRAVVVGGGASGRAIGAAIAARGWAVQLSSRRTGFDVLRDDVVAALNGADVVVEATGRFTTSRRRATDFFVRSTTAVGSAAAAVGARHVLLSIVGCERPEVQGYGYFAGKAAQERAAATTGAELSVVRSTQWHEFAEQNAGRFRVGRFVLVPGMTVAPVALGTVAAVVGDVVTGKRSGRRVEVAGPQVTTLRAMTEALPDPVGRIVPVRLPGALGRAFRDGALLPGPEAEIVGPSFDEWVAVPAAH